MWEPNPEKADYTCTKFLKIAEFLIPHLQWICNGSSLQNLNLRKCVSAGMKALKTSEENEPRKQCFQRCSYTNDVYLYDNKGKMFTQPKRAASHWYCRQCPQCLCNKMVLIFYWICYLLVLFLVFSGVEISRKFSFHAGVIILSKVKLVLQFDSLHCDPFSMTEPRAPQASSWPP